jgi:hypothetical protein
LAYVQPLESRQAAATTATSRVIAAIPQFYERPIHQNPRNIVTMTASRAVREMNSDDLY